MNVVAVRAARPADAAGIARVHVASWRAAYANIVPQEFLDGLSEERRAAFWADSLANSATTQRTWVAEQDGRIVGFVGTAEPEAADAGDVEAGALEVATIYVLPGAWGQGIGRALMDRAVEHHAVLGSPELVLWVFAANDRARRFYERTGWRIDGATRTLSIGGADLPIVRYRFDLREVST